MSEFLNLLKFVSDLSKPDTKTLSDKYVKSCEEHGDIAKVLLPYLNRAGTLHRFSNQKKVVEEIADTMLSCWDKRDGRRRTETDQSQIECLVSPNFVEPSYQDWTTKDRNRAVEPGCTFEAWIDSDHAEGLLFRDSLGDVAGQHSGGGGGFP